MAFMSSRIHPSWTVVESVHTPEADRCVDVFSRPDGTWGFEEFRRDAEDMGRWTPLWHYAATAYGSRAEVIAAATRLVTWLGPLLDQ